MFIKNSFKKVLVCILALCLAFPMFANTTPAYAARTDTLVKSLSLSTTKKTMALGQSFTLKVKAVAKDGKTVVPSKAGLTVSFKSSNQNVATVTNKGVVKALRKGTSTVTVTAKSSYNKTFKAICKVNVVLSTNGAANATIKAIHNHTTPEPTIKKQPISTKNVGLAVSDWAMYFYGMTRKELEENGITDCTSFVGKVYQDNGVSLSFTQAPKKGAPRDDTEYLIRPTKGKKITTASQLVPGDIVTYPTTKYFDTTDGRRVRNLNIAIYIGTYNGQKYVAHYSIGEGVRVDKMNYRPLVIYEKDDNGAYKLDKNGNKIVSCKAVAYRVA